MSQVNAVNHQVGMNSTPENNFVLSASSNDGTMSIKRGGVAQQQVLGFDANGYTIAITPPKGDATTKSATTAFVKNAMVASGIIGASLNAYMFNTSASLSATWSADMLVVAESLSGQTYSLSSLSLSINLGTVGAGGMDTGSIPANGYVAIYVIYNPTSKTAALMGVNTTAIVAPEVYGGSSMPTGYTASALVGIRLTSGSLMTVGAQIGRHVGILTSQVFSATSVVPSTPTSLSLSACVPLNAKKVDLFQRFVSTTAELQQLAITSTANPIGLVGSLFNASAAGQQFGSTDILDLVYPQTLYYYQTAAISTTRQLYVTGYTF